ncbi:probable Iron-sulfur clusters transporter ATM1, mitochondrial [Hanseniaspora guilliermondii]|uniref:Iron-sulfur clusters transporter ATM1, mitochondrial n=1 Tax=Hanseniaspora guilliermondii TaxID=56406 RepID=A0A1L0B0R9_9ASCO|nr:probable Iron-sulfur clusters transporter ATM1, mitochondrial [Hanseniaspora guilliermondii]
MLVGTNRFILNDVNKNLFIKGNLFLKPYFKLKSFQSYNSSRSYSYFTSKCNKFSIFNINKFSFRSFHQSRTINNQVKQKPKSISEIKILKTLFKYIWPKDNKAVKIRVVVSFSLLLLAKVLNIEVPFFFKKIIDDMNGDSDESADFVKDNAFPIAVAITILSYGLSRFGAVLFGELRNAVFAKVSQNAIKTVSLQTFKHLMKLDLNWHLSRQTGGLTRAMDRGTKGISYVLSAMVFHIIPITFEISLVCGILTYQFGSSFAAVTFTTMLLYALFTFRTTAWRTQFRRNANKADNKASSVIVDSLLNFESVKYFNNEAMLANKYNTNLTNYRDSQVKVSQSLAFLNSGQNFIFTSALTLMMYMACKGVVMGNMTVGDLVLVNQLVFQLSVPLNFLGSVYRELKQSLVDMENLFELQENPVKIQNNGKGLILRNAKEEGLPYDIEFKNVTFGYSPERLILNDCSFIIPKGCKTGIVGPSGSGKSTILKLIFRFYDPIKGDIFIDGINIKDLDVDNLRRNIGVVPQDSPLFNDTIYENLKFGNVNATDEQIRKAVENAQMTSFLNKLPNGLNTVVGERGLMISGGEKQRLAIARVLLKDTPIMFFDEATSALDTYTEQSLLGTIKNSLSSINEQKTSVFIAHRLRTILDSDKIIVLENGRVVDEGTHTSLLSHNGLYKNLWNIQENIDQLDEEVLEDKKKKNKN